MNTWAPIWSGIVSSSLWEEDGDVVKVFMTLLATKNSDHVSELDAYRIHKMCNIDELKVLDILKLLASPDTRRRTGQDFEGRRIKAVEGGWLILNGEKYRDMVEREKAKARNRRSQEAWRRRQKALAVAAPHSPPLPGETSTLKAAELGASQEQQDKISDASLPEPVAEEPERCGHGVVVGEDCFDCRSDAEYRKENEGL